MRIRLVDDTMGAEYINRYLNVNIVDGYIESFNRKAFSSTVYPDVTILYCFGEEFRVRTEDFKVALEKSNVKVKEI